MRVDVAFLPTDIKQHDLSDGICIVLDIFRATTSIVTAMANGCNAILPVSKIEDAHSLGKQINSPLFAGERQSIKIEGFDFGNSPYDFSTDKVQNRTIIMTTTNGTKAIQATEGSYLTLIGSFINAAAVCKQARQYGKDIVIVCAGTEQHFSLEDALCAGLLVHILSEEEDSIMTDAALGARVMYDGAKSSIIAVASNSKNGKRLCDIDRVNDIEYCLQLNTVSVVPRYNNGKITLLDAQN